MNDYKRKRLDFINRWPDSDLFEAEKNYISRCDAFINENNIQPFMPMHMWYESDKEYNIALSRIIECLESMPYNPHHAFSQAFICFDLYSEKYISDNITERIKMVVERVFVLSQQHTNIDQMFSHLFSSFPMQVALFVYKSLFQDFSLSKKVYNRIINDSNNTINVTRKALLDDLYAKFGYDNNNYSNSIRKGAALIRKIFVEDTIVLCSNTYKINHQIRLHILLSGFLYSLRNCSMHGDSISTTKSSRTSPERYALNYYAFLCQYCICILMLIDKSSILSDKNTTYNDLIKTMNNNTCNMKLLFGSHMG